MYRLSLLIAWRSRYQVIVISFYLLLIGVAYGASQFSGRQPATVAMDIGLSFLKLSLPLLIALLFQDLISKEFERRYFLYSLSYPFDRARFIISRFMAVFSIALATLLFGALLLQVLVAFVESTYDQSRPVSVGLEYWMAVCFVALDILVIASVSLLLAVVAKTPGFVLLGTIGFAIVARSYGAILDLLSGNIIIVERQEEYRSTLSLIRIILPDLGALDMRHIALYDDVSNLPANFGIGLISVTFFCIAVLSLAMFLFKRRRLD